MTTASLDNIKNGPLRKTTEDLSALIELLIETGVLVHDNQGTTQSHQVLVHKFNQIIKQLEEIPSNETSQFPIPLDIINYIEDGRNPDIYTREFIEVNAKSNARLKAKMENFAKLRDILSVKVGNEFPDLKDVVDDICNRTNNGR